MNTETTESTESAEVTGITESLTARYARWSSLPNLRKECVRLSISVDHHCNQSNKARTKNRELRDEIRKLKIGLTQLAKENTALKDEVRNLRPAEQPEIVETVTVSEVAYDTHFGNVTRDALIARDSESRFYKLDCSRGGWKWERLPLIVPPLDEPAEEEAVESAE